MMTQESSRIVARELVCPCVESTGNVHCSQAKVIQSLPKRQTTQHVAGQRVTGVQRIELGHHSRVVRMTENELPPPTLTPHSRCEDHRCQLFQSN